MHKRHTFLYTLQFRRNAIWLIPLLLLLTSPLWSIPVGNFLAPRGEEPHTVSQKERNFNLQGVKITLNRNGMKTALIISSDARTAKADTLIMTDVTADLYDEDGKVTKIRAKEGEYNTKNEQLTLKKDIVINKAADQQVLYTQLLYFDNRNQTLQCPGATRITAKGADLSGGSFSYDIKSATYTLGKPVQCEFTEFTSNH